MTLQERKLLHARAIDAYEEDKRRQLDEERLAEETRILSAKELFAEKLRPFAKVKAEDVYYAQEQQWLIMPVEDLSFGGSLYDIPLNWPRIMRQCPRCGESYLTATVGNLVGLGRELSTPALPCPQCH